MKDYELTVLFHPDLEMNLDPALDKVKKAIEASKGKINRIDSDGKKRLSYSINGQTFALYYFYTLSLPAEAPAKISSTLNITDEVLRYLLVRAINRKNTPAQAKDAKESKETSEDTKVSTADETKDSKAVKNDTNLNEKGE